MGEPVFDVCKKNDADQTAQPHSLVNIIAVPLLGSTITKASFDSLKTARLKIY